MTKSKTIENEVLNKKNGFIWFDILSYGPLAYILLLPTIFSFAPTSVTMWLDFWDYGFKLMPSIFPFVRYADSLVMKNDYTMPVTYYTHCFWLLLIVFIALCAYIKKNFQALFFKRIENRKNQTRMTLRKLTIGRPSVRSFGFVHNMLFFITFAVFGIIGIFSVIFGFLLEFIFDTSISAPFGPARIINTWWGQHVKPLVFIWFVLLVPTYSIPYFAAVIYRHFLSFGRRLDFRRHFETAGNLS